MQIYSNTSSRKQTFTSIDSGVVNSTLVIDICSYEFGLMLTHNFEVSLVDRSLDTLQVKIVGTFTSPSLNQTSSNVIHIKCINREGIYKKTGFNLIQYFTAESLMSNNRPPHSCQKSCVGLIALELAPTVNYWFKG